MSDQNWVVVESADDEDNRDGNEESVIGEDLHDQIKGCNPFLYLKFITEKIEMNSWGVRMLLFH